MNPSDQNRNIYLLAGPVQSGKTTLVSHLVARLRSRGVKVSGFLARAHFRKGIRTGFILIDISTGKQLPLAFTEKVEGWTKYRHFYFNPQAMQMGREILLRAVEKRDEMIIVDEVGPMELEGEGWAETLELLQGNRDLAQLWVVREKIAGDVADKWKIPADHLLRVEESDTIRRIEMILGIC